MTMPVSCQDCGTHFLLSNGDVIGAACPGCGGTRMERDQPGGTNSDGDLRNMVDPGTGLDQGGNPLQEGIWANTDGGWQPYTRRDESFASVMSSFDTNPYEPLFDGKYEWQQKTAFLPALAPLLAPAAGMLLRRFGPSLLLGALRGQGNHAEQPEQALPGPAPTQMLAKTADIETPDSVPSVGDHDDPEAVDQQEFDAGDMSPAGNNPNLNGEAGGSQDMRGEDAVQQRLEFNDEDTIGDLHGALPKLLEYYHSDKSGLEDPIIRGLHEKINQRYPGYLEHADDESIEPLLQAMREPGGITSALVQPGMQPGMGFPQQQPLNPALPGQRPSLGHCENCGGTLDANGSCAQCGASNVGQIPQQGANPMGTGVLGVPTLGREAAVPMEPDQMSHEHEVPCMYCQSVGRLSDGTPCPMCHGTGTWQPTGHEPHDGYEGIADMGGVRDVATFADMAGVPFVQGPMGPRHQGAYHQGPITPEQQAAVADLLNQMGRGDEVSNMLLNPDQYIDLLQQVQNDNQTVPPTVDPNEQPPAQPAPPMDPSQMGMAPGGMPGPGGPMPPMMGKTAADNVAPRCPNCESATTGLINTDGACRCHKCNHIWDAENGVKEKISRVWKVSEDHDHGVNTDALPAADQERPEDVEQEQDSSLHWKDVTGAPLVVGQEYELHNPSYQIPDIVRVDAVKPDGITVTIAGEFSPDQQGGPEYTHDLSWEEVEMNNMTFVPSGGGDDTPPDPNAQQGDGPGQTVNTEPVETPDMNRGIRASVEDPNCPKCGFTHVTASMTSPTTKHFECYKCAHEWNENDEDEDIEIDPANREWLNGDSSPLEFSDRTLAMASSGTSRNIQDIAKRDPRNAEVRERLNKNAGARFSPREQREFIDEDGTARNADLLDLEGTHYEARFDSRARPDRVDDNYLALGL